jgi:YaiO family outer membrane protein
MKNYFFILLLMAIALFFFSGTTPASDSVPKEKALQALRTQDYETAINISLQQLESNPENYEFSFILSRAYAFSGQRDKALSVIDRMLIKYPENIDLLLFRSRIQAWQGKYKVAESGFDQVLLLDPENREAFIGKAEIKSWRGEYKEAIEKYGEILKLDPEDGDIHFRIGRMYQWSGNYQKAKEYYQQAVRLEPENAEFRKALKNARPLFHQSFELRYQYKNEGFSDERENYIDHQLMFSLKISPALGSLHLKYNKTHRFGTGDTQYGIELYPHLWKRAYGYVDLNYSPKAIHYPRTSYLFEAYQGFFRSGEFSVGFRRMNFNDNPVSVYLGSAGYYIGNYFPFLRWYYTPEDKGANFSWFVNVRRYFSEDNYLAVGYGQGSRPFDIITEEDILVRNSWIFFAEGDWCFLKRIRIKIQFMHRSEEEGLKRNSIFVATGYRW